MRVETVEVDARHAGLRPLFRVVSLKVRCDMSRLAPWLFWIGLVLCVAKVAGADERLDELIRNAPEGGNSVAIVRVADLLKSPRAVKEGWADKSATEFLAGAAAIPSWVDTLVVSSLVRPEVPEEVWSVGIVSLPKDLKLDQIAQREAASIVNVAGHRAIESAHNTFFVELTPDTLGTMRPAIRQSAARWLKACDNRADSALSPYLKQATARTQHIVLALDMADMISPTRLREYLRQSSQLRDQKADTERVCDLLTTLRGVTLTVQVTESLRAELSIDFDAEVGDLGPEVRQVFVEIAQTRGLGLNDFNASELITEGRSVRLVTGLSDEGLRHVMSLVVSPLPAKRVAKATVAPEYEASKRYYASIVRSLEDLDRVTKNVSNLASIATWHENHAKKIEHLPNHDVDSELLDFGSSVSAKLRALAASLRGIAVEINADEKSITYNVQVDPGWSRVNIWGGAGYKAPSMNVSSNLKEVRERQAAAIGRGSQKREQIWTMIRDEQASIERKMREKFGRSFNTK